MKERRRKSEYKCAGSVRKTGGKVNKEGVDIVKADEFKYLESTTQSNARHIRGMKKRVWSGWKQVPGVICDRKTATRVKEKVCKAAVRSAMIYGWRQWQ